MSGDSSSVEVALGDLENVTEVCFNVTASNRTKTVTLEGKYYNTGKIINWSLLKV